VVLLENTRFHAGDTRNDDGFAAALGALADVYVCDAFGVLHRKNASVTVCAKSRVRVGFGRAPGATVTVWRTLLPDDSSWGAAKYGRKLVVLCI
jgi:hypothetical protein